MISPSHMLISNILSFSPVVFSGVPALGRSARMATSTHPRKNTGLTALGLSNFRTCSETQYCHRREAFIFTQHHNLILHLKLYSYTALRSYPVNHFIINNNTKYIRWGHSGHPWKWSWWGAWGKIIS